MWRARQSQVRSIVGLKTEQNHFEENDQMRSVRREQNSKIILTTQQKPPHYLFFHLRQSSSRVMLSLRYSDSIFTYFAIFGT